MGFIWRRGKHRHEPESQPDEVLRDVLYAMDDALEEVSPEALHARDSWDRTQFDDVLHRVETLTPAFQSALVDFLSSDTQHDRAQISALLAVDRLSAAYTYWTRLFPPRQSDETMFVLSLLHDLGEKVATAIRRLERSQ